MNPTTKQWSLPVALSLIVTSIFIVTGLGFLLIQKNRHVFPFVSHSSQPLTHLILTGPQRDALSSYFIEEMLDLSQDCPLDIKKVSLKEKEKQLLKAPMIKEAYLSFLAPSTLYVDYTLREPIALVADYENIAIDDQGYLFPFFPFYSPKQLPFLYFGNTIEQKIGFEKPLQSPSFSLAKEILFLFKKKAKEHNFSIQKIDVSKAYEKSLGQQEIVIDLAEDLFDKIEQRLRYLYHLRVAPREYKKQLGHYLVLHKELMEEFHFDPKERFDEKMIDLRLDDIAYITAASTKAEKAEQSHIKE